MPLDFAQVRLSRTTFGRALLGQGVWDSEAIKASTNTQILNFFAKPIGQGDASGQITAKNYGETNLEQARQLPQSNRMEVHRFGIVFYGNTAGSPLTPTDFYKILLGSWFTLTISGIIVAQKPLADIPFGVAPFVPTDTNTNTYNPQVGEAHVSNAINVKMVTKSGKSYNPTIESGESFSGTINWPAVISLSVDVRVRVKLDGIYVRPV